NNQILAPKDPMVRFQSYLHGGTSSLLSVLSTFPVYKTVFRQQIHNTPVHSAVGQLYKEVMRTLSGTLLFGLQDTLLQHLSRTSHNINTSSSVLPALAGFGAGFVEALLFTPFERVQSVLQNGQNDSRLPTHKSVLVRLKTERLAAGFYRGFVPVTARNSLGSALYFGLKGPVCAAVAGGGLSPLVASFVSGAITSMTISLTLHPLSVLVANMQAQVGRELKGVRGCWKELMESRQWSIVLLYRGGSLVILRSCITWGIATALYDRQEKRSG
uniref:Solute carrier family 25 member 53 n=1 Tax=Neogobius melanostomus TaxID=47308 RepID=A0A8C6T5D7_9GOBI